MESGGVLHHGTYEEDGLVTWEALVFPRVIPVRRRAGYPSPKLARPQAHVLIAEFAWQNKRLSRGRPLDGGSKRSLRVEPRPKEARESEGLI